MAIGTRAISTAATPMYGIFQLDQSLLFGRNIIQAIEQYLCKLATLSTDDNLAFSFGEYLEITLHWMLCRNSIRKHWNVMSSNSAKYQQMSLLNAFIDYIKCYLAISKWQIQLKTHITVNMICRIARRPILLLHIILLNYKYNDIFVHIHLKMLYRFTGLPSEICFSGWFGRMFRTSSLNFGFA